MRIVSLNTWGGRAGKEGLLAFFKMHADTTDIFCLQEIWSAPYEHLEGHLAGGLEIDNEQIMVYGLQEISAALPSHVAFFRPHHGDHYGLLMLVNKNLSVIEEGDVFVYKERGYVPDGDVGNHARNIQYITAETASGLITVINFHGLWTGEGPGKGKKDSPERLEQSEKILEFTKQLKNPFVLCGDFNLLPDTESIRKFEDAGLRNLIKEFGVTSTRTSFYTKPQKFADYVFISGDVDLKDFKVLPNEVSDHAPLLIEI
ncbi:MAG: endonuclease/exonuclease/phosphatase family protein [Candidatus Paceibacterota bacterium]|jgi:endonuclease/exonuclease/phosphatase family metal-dependent hydrolase